MSDLRKLAERIRNEFYTWRGISSEGAMLLHVERILREDRSKLVLRIKAALDKYNPQIGDLELSDYGTGAFDAVQGIAQELCDLLEGGEQVNDGLGKAEAGLHATGGVPEMAGVQQEATPVTGLASAKKFTVVYTLSFRGKETEHFMTFCTKEQAVKFAKQQRFEGNKATVYAGIGKSKKPLKEAALDGKPVSGFAPQEVKDETLDESGDPAALVPGAAVGPDPLQTGAGSPAAVTVSPGDVVQEAGHPEERGIVRGVDSDGDIIVEWTHGDDKGELLATAHGLITTLGGCPVSGFRDDREYYQQKLDESDTREWELRQRIAELESDLDEWVKAAPTIDRLKRELGEKDARIAELERELGWFAHAGERFAELERKRDEARAERDLWRAFYTYTESKHYTTFEDHNDWVRLDDDTIERVAKQHNQWTNEDWDCFTEATLATFLRDLRDGKLGEPR